MKSRDARRVRNLSRFANQKTARTKVRYGIDCPALAADYVALEQARRRRERER